MTSKTTELYSLPQNALDTQADMILSQFTIWVDNNFTLTTAQADCLAALDGQFHEQLKIVVSDSVRNREPITQVISGEALTEAANFSGS